MGTRGWTLSTFLGCFIWILHGLGAAAVPVTTEEPFTVGTAFPITAENEGPSALVTGTAYTSTTAADAEIDESIFPGSPLSSTFPPGTEPDSFVTAMGEYSSTVPTLMNVTKPLNTSQGIDRELAAPTAAMTAAAITAQHPAVTPEAEYEVIEANPDPTLDITPDVKEDIPSAVTRQEDIDLTTGNISRPTTPPPADAWLPQPTTGSPVGVGVTVLPSQGLTKAMGAVEEVVNLPTSIQSGANGKSSSPSPSTEELLTTQEGGVVSGVEAANPEPAEEMAPAAEESPLASESGDARDATNGDFSTASSSHLPPESPVISGTVANPGEPFLLPGQTDALLTPSTGDGDGQGVPGVSTEASGSTLSPAASEAPVAPEETEGTATSLLVPEVPTDAQSDTNLPTLATALPTGDMGTVSVDNPSLQPDPWQTTTGEEPPLLPDALTDTPSAAGAAYTPSEDEANTLPAADGAAETPSSSDITTAPEAPMSPSLGESQPGRMPDGAPQEVHGPDTGLSSDSDAPSPAPFVPDGLAWPAAGVQGQGAQGTEDVAQAGGPGDGSPYTDTQSDMNPSVPQPSFSPANNGELVAGGTGDLTNAGQAPPSALREGTGAGAAPAPGEVSSPGSVPPSSAGMEPNLSGAEGPAELPSESTTAPGAVYPLPGSVSGPMSGAETPLSPNLSSGQGAPGSPPFGGSQPWETAVGAPQGAGLPGAEGPDSGLTSPWDAPSSAVHGPVGPPSPAPGDQLGPNLGLPAAGGPGAGTAEQALEGAGSGIDSEPSLSSTAGSGMAAGIDQLPGEGASSGPASPSDVVAAPSFSRGDEAGPISGAVPGPDSLSPASLDSKTGPGLGLVEGAESTGDVAQAGNPEVENSYMETSPSGFSPQQDPTNNRELVAGGTGDLTNAEQAPPSALREGTGAGAAPAPGEVSSPGSVPPSSAGMEPNLSGAEGPAELPSESTTAPGAVYPLPGSVSGPMSGAETPLSPNLSSGQGAPGSPPFGGSQPWETAVGAPQGAGLPGAEGPDSGLTSPWDAPSSAVHGPVGPPSPAPGDQLGPNLGLPAAGGPGAGTAEQALEGAGSGIDSEPSLSSTAGSGMAAGIDQLPGEGASSGPASPGDVVAAPSFSRGDEAGPISGAVPGPDSLSPASLDSENGLVEGTESAGDVAQAGNPKSPYVETNPSAFSPQEDQLPGAGSSSGPAPPSGEAIASSVSDPASQSALGGAGNAPGALHPSLGVGPGVPTAAGEGTSEVASDGESMGQSQAPTGKGPAGSGTPDEERGDVLQSASSSSSTEGSSLPGGTDEAVNEASLPGAGGANSGLNTGLESAGLQEAPVSVPGIQSGANIGLYDGKQNKVNVIEVPEGASLNEGSSLGASLVPVAPNNSGISDSTATSTAGSLLLPEHGLSSGLAPNGDTHSAPGTQSGSRPLVPGAPAGLAGESGGVSWSLEDELASGMPAPSGEASLHAPISPNAAPMLPSAPQRGNAAEGASVSPGLSAPLAARELIVGSSAGGKGELGSSVPGRPVLLLPPCQPGSTGAPSRDADSPVPGKASVVLPGVMVGQENMARLLPSVTGSGADTETPTHSPLQGSPGLPGLPPTEITVHSTGSKIPGPGPTGGSPSTALQPIVGSELATSSASGAPATAGLSLPRAFPGHGGSQGGSSDTACPGTSCSPAPADPTPQAPILRGREMLPRPGTATVTSHTSSPVVPAPPGRPAAAPTPLPSPAVPAVPLYGYGARENDQEYVERRVDFNSPLFKPETGFPFGRTLRDSLYFTDNGQIIFPASDKGIFTYPNPPSGGFNGHEEVPMIAVFWDNADFSRGVGTTFYQEFSTLNTAKPPFVRDVEAKVRRYMRSSYSAAWTLKITWEKAPVYSSWTDIRKTITYQAVLTTDGYRSYILMLYQDRGMQWDYTRLTATNVLIGYTSGDGFYHNDDLSKRPPAAKYRPDQFRGYNTDLRGLWIYKLESRMGTNYRLKCLAWTGQQQEPRAWSQGLPTCPCSLQQGQQDPRFKSSRGGRWAARVSMLHSASPNQHGAGVRCLYDSQNQLIEGRQERYWRSSRQASPYRDQELKLYDWCCNRAGSAHLCALYSEKRPKIGCDGYQSLGMDSSEEVDRDSDEEIDEDDK